MGSKKELPKEVKTPKLADSFLRWFCKDELLECVEGDLYEQYCIEREERGKFRANLAYYLHVINFLRPFAIKNRSQNSNHIM